MSDRGALLLIVPTVPALTGNGLAMRAALALQLLAARHDVSLLIIPLHGPVDAALAPALARVCRHVAMWPGLDAAAAQAAFHAALRMSLSADGAPADGAPPAGFEPLMRAAPWLADRFATVHLYRLTTIAFARPWLFGNGAQPRPRRHLDLDEVESVSRRRLAALYQRTGQDAAARFAALEAARCEALERHILDGFDRVYVCSDAEARHLPQARRADVRVLPNALPVDASADDPDLPDPPRTGGGPFGFLFVGTLAFTPNVDAVMYFSRDVLPRLRDLVGDDPFDVAIVGSAPAALQQWVGASSEGMREVRLIGAVPDVGPWYARAAAVIVPLRAGGGTRIKVLEAMRYRRPIVSTSAGIDGYALRDGDEVLVGDTAEAFAAQCARLMRDRALGPRLGAAAHARYLAHHTPAAAARALDD